MGYYSDYSNEDLIEIAHEGLRQPSTGAEYWDDEFVSELVRRLEQD